LSEETQTVAEEVHSSHRNDFRASILRILLYLTCVLIDFSAFLVVFTASRSLADGKAPQWYLGVVGAGLSFTAGIGSILGGYFSYRFDGRVIFVSGLTGIALCTLASRLIEPQNPWFLVGYWSLGISLGLAYPPLIGWLNQGEDAHSNRVSVSRRLILFCVAWNFGMMCGQLIGGSLYERGQQWALTVSLFASIFNGLMSFVIVWLVSFLPPISTVAVNESTRSDAVELASTFKRLGWIANVGGVFGASMVFHLLPEVMVEINIPATEHGNLLAYWRLMIIASYFVLHYSTFWHYRFSVSLLSQALGAVGLLVIACSYSDVRLMIGLALLGQLVGYNYFSGLYYSAAGSAGDGRALAAGIHEATLATGMALGTIIGGVLGSAINSRVPYVFASLVIFVIILIQFVAWQKWTSQPK